MRVWMKDEQNQGKYIEWNVILILYISFLQIKKTYTRRVFAF